MHLLLSVVVAFQLGSDTLLTRFAGQWSGTGTVLNQPSKISLAWTWKLGGQFLRLTFRNEIPKATFEGHAYYRPIGDPSTYRLTSDFRMEIVDRVKSKDGSWREFGRSVVTR